MQDLDEIKRNREGCWSPKYSRICHDSDEAGQSRTEESDRCGFLKHSHQPITGARVAYRVLAVGINQNVNVREEHCSLKLRVFVVLVQHATNLP